MNANSELKAQFIAAAQVYNEGNSITVGTFTATKQKSGFLARMFGYSNWEVSAEPEKTQTANGFSSFSYSGSMSGFGFSQEKVIDKLATLAANKPQL